MSETMLHFEVDVLKKPSIVFTWDDDFERHYSVIGQLFNQFGMRCTFFINPGEPKFTPELSGKYLQLNHSGFEIGSHGYTHHHYLKLSLDELAKQLQLSRQSIHDLTGIYPVSFAFPHHEFTPDMLKMAKEYYLETRNTLRNSLRFGLKSYTTVEDAQNILESAIQNGKSLIFSGHSVRLPKDTVADGYEPVKIEVLRSIIKLCIKTSDKFDICTFEKAILKDYVLSQGIVSGTECYISCDKINHLSLYGVSLDRLISTLKYEKNQISVDYLCN